MHQTMFDAAFEFRLMYVEQWFPKGRKLQLLDIGSRDVGDGGTFRFLFDDTERYEYVGVDMEPGDNVDVVVSDPYHFDELGERTFDIILCGSCIEHSEFFWLLGSEIKRRLRPGGAVFICAPHIWPIHRHPVDCYRFNPDGMLALAKWIGLEEPFIRFRNNTPAESSLVYCDLTLIGHAPGKPHD
jgi:SAM-dependent methyltransferase